MKLLPIAEESAERFYLVTGAMRTGSTMVGRLLRSLRNFEVFHEPDPPVNQPTSRVK